MAGVTPSMRGRLEALAVILGCLLLFGLLAYLCHVWRYPARVMAPMTHGEELMEMDDYHETQAVMRWRRERL